MIILTQNHVLNYKSIIGCFESCMTIGRERTKDAPNFLKINNCAIAVIPGPAKMAIC